MNIFWLRYSADRGVTLDKVTEWTHVKWEPWREKDFTLTRTVHRSYTNVRTKQLPSISLTKVPGIVQPFLHTGEGLFPDLSNKRGPIPQIYEALAYFGPRTQLLIRGYDNLPPPTDWPHVDAALACLENFAHVSCSVKVHHVFILRTQLWWRIFGRECNSHALNSRNRRCRGYGGPQSPMSAYQPRGPPWGPYLHLDRIWEKLCYHWTESRCARKGMVSSCCIPWGTLRPYTHIHVTWRYSHSQPVERNWRLMRYAHLCTSN